MAIIYLHGFASSGVSPKVDALKARFPDQCIAAPNLPVEPEAAIAAIRTLVHDLYRKGEQKFLFIGTSLGGFYAWYSSALYDSPAILVNPAISPGTSLERALGKNRNFATGEEFEWKPEYLQQLRTMGEWVKSNYDPRLVHVAVAMDDAILDAKATIDHFNGSEIDQHETGGHRFDDIEKVFPAIERRYGGIREQVED
jgi:uncharacterized protein